MERIKIDLTPSCMKPVLRASQYDNGREWPCEVLKDGTPYKFVQGDVCEIHVRKGDGCGVTASVPVTVGQSFITITSTEQMCAVYGDNIGELVVTNGTKKIGSCNLILSVEADPMNGSKSSNSEIHDLQNQVNECVDEALSHKGASDIAFDNTDTGLEANNVQNAIEEVNTKTDAKADSDDVYDKTYIDNAFTGVNNSLNTKMDKENPVGTGSFSLNRKSGTTVGSASIAMGNNNTASSAYSVAIGINNTASEKRSIAIGSDNFSGAYSSVAMGGYSSARGNYACAIGNHAFANRRGQFVFGEYNEAESLGNPAQRGTYVEIVGNGTDDSHPSNARTLDWQGNETIAGDLTYNGYTSLTSEISRLDDKIDNLPAPMIFKGTLGVGGTIQTLPTASTSNEGFTYKVITDGTYAGQTAKVGDVFTSNGSAWVYIPSGDEDTDTWRAIKVNGVEKLGNGISSGSLDVVDTDNIEAEFDNNGNKLKIKTRNIYTQSEVDTLIANAVDSVLPTDSVAKSAIANFETDYAKPIEFKAYIEAVQASGTPTPSTPKAISGWSQVEITHADENMQTVETVLISLGQTVYGGYVTQDKDGHRQLVVTHEIIDLGTLSWTYDSNYSFFVSNIVGAKKGGTRYGAPCLCENYESAYINHGTSWATVVDKTIAIGSNYDSTKNVVLKDTDYTNPTVFGNSLSGVDAVYELTEPIVIDLPDGEPINALIGTNNLFADSGDMECSFKCGVAMYVDNHSGGGNRSVNLAKSVEGEVKDEPKDEPETRQER